MSVRSGTPLREFLKESLQGPDVKREYEALGPTSDLIVALVKLRVSAGLTQAQLAGRLGTTQGYIARIESTPANLTLKTLTRIAGALGADLLLRFEPTGEAPPLDVNIPASKMLAASVLDRFK